MDIDAATTAAVSIATALGGFLGGKKIGVNGSIQIANDTVSMLSLQVDLLEKKNEHQEAEIADLKTRVDVLQDISTQRANVEAVKEVVDRIAEKVGA